MGKAKRILSGVLVLLLLVFSLGACQPKNEPGTIIDRKKIADVMLAVDAAFTAKYGENAAPVETPVAVDKTYLRDWCNIDPAWVDETTGNVSESITNSDAFFVVKAKEGFEEQVRLALASRLKDLQTQYECFPVNYSYERAVSGEVLRQGRYVFFIAVGLAPARNGQTPLYRTDVSLAEQTIKSMFNQ